MSCKVRELGTGFLRLESEELSVPESEDMMSQDVKVRGRGESSRQHGNGRCPVEGRQEGERGTNCKNGWTDGIRGEKARVQK